MPVFCPEPGQHLVLLLQQIHHRKAASACLWFGLEKLEPSHLAIAAAAATDAITITQSPVPVTHNLASADSSRGS